jgi:RHS repeat-associated protein
VASQLTAAEDPDSEYAYTYDNLGRVIERIDPLGNVTTYAYTGFTSAVTVTLPDPDGEEGPLQSPTYSQTFDLAGSLIESIDPLGAVTSYEYDDLGRLVTVTLPDPDGGGALAAPVTEYEYDKLGNLRFVTDPLGNVTEYVYDVRNRLVGIIEADPDGAGPLASPEWEYAYDDAGQLTSATDPLGRVTTWQYDGLGRLISETLPDPDGEDPLAAPQTLFAYDAASRLVSVTDPLGNVTQYAYDPLDNLVSTALPDPDGPLTTHNSPLTTFTYDAVGNLLSLTDPVGNTTEWDYDNLDRVTAETNELNKARTFKYDAVGNLTERIDRLGRKTVWEYDSLYRGTAEKWYDGASLVRTLSYSYDAAGQLLSAADPAAAYEFEYDLLGRLTSELQSLTGLAFDIAYQSEFDANSRRTQLLALLGGQADFANSYLYDNLNRLTVLTQQSGGSGPGANVVAEKRVDFAYTAASQFSKISRYADWGGFELVANTFYDYDGIGRLSSLIHSTDATAPVFGWGSGALAGYEFTYDAASRITAINSFVDGFSGFDYDNTDQLTAAGHTGQADETYTYDENGNRTMSGYSTTDNNQLTTDGIYNYTYDDEGNRLTKTRISTGEKEEYGWDHRNRLTGLTFKNSSGTIIKTVEHTYDIFNRWIKRSVDADGPGSGAADDTFFSWEAGQINLQFDGEGDLTHRYLWNPVAVDHVFAVENVLSLMSAGEVLWLLTDHLGTPRDLASYDDSTDEVTIENHRVFNSFGQLISETNASFTTLVAFTGVFFDASTSLNYHRARWLDLPTGRWMSEDPIGFGGMDPNLVRYVANRSTTSTDPSGLIDSKDEAAEIVLNIMAAQSAVKWHEDQLSNPFAFMSYGEHSSKLAEAKARIEQLRKEFADKGFDQLCFGDQGYGMRGATAYAEWLAITRRQNQEKLAAQKGGGIESEGAGPFELLMGGKVGVYAGSGILKWSFNKAGQLFFRNQLTGQIHHPISTKIGKALANHPSLKGKYVPRDPRFTTQACDKAAHNGYQKWHRDLDQEVIDWIQDPLNSSATPAEFEAWLRWRYSQPDLKSKFPKRF